MIMVMKQNAVLQVAMQMMEHVAQCARRGPHGEWIITPDERTQQVGLGAQFLADIARAAGVQKPDIKELEIPPLNTRVVDGNWVRRTEAMAEHAAKELGCVAVLLTIKDGGKFSVDVGGEKTAVGEELAYVKMLDADGPRFFIEVAKLVHLAELKDATEPRQ